jgi:hypothetical protein
MWARSLDAAALGFAYVPDDFCPELANSRIFLFLVY